jgi:hypothetical protein
MDRSRHRIGLRLLAVAGAALVAACGAGNPTGTTASTPDTTPRADATGPIQSGTGWPSATGPIGPGPLPSATGPIASPTSVAQQAGCQTGQLRTELGQASAAAGTVGFPIVFTNTGAAPCVLAGFPGVSYVTGPSGDPVGASAAHDGAAGGPVRLAPGGQASALVLAVNVGNYPAAQCAPVHVPGLRVYPPDNTAARYLARPSTACRNPAPQQLRVRAVVPGTSGF